jgi:hypothetical protein
MLYQCGNGSGPFCLKVFLRQNNIEFNYIEAVVRFFYFSQLFFGQVRIQVADGGRSFHDDVMLADKVDQL